MKILIAGAGAVGGYFGARLIQAGRDVTFLVRDKRAKELHDGLTLIDPSGGRGTIAVRTTTAADLHESYDLLILAVKAGALATVLDQLAPAVGPDTLILPLLNGMAQLEQLNERFGSGRVLGGLVRVVTTVTGSGEIHQLKSIATMDFGPQDGTLTRRLKTVAAELDVPGYELTLGADIVGDMWKKWIFIVSAGVITCLLRGSIGQILAAGGRDFIDQVIAETQAVGRAAGHPVAEADHAATRQLLTEPGSIFTSSLYRDVVAGLPHEGEHLLGSFVAAAATYAVDVPLTRLALLQLRTHDQTVSRP